MRRLELSDFLKVAQLSGSILRSGATELQCHLPMNLPGFTMWIDETFTFLFFKSKVTHS